MRVSGVLLARVLSPARDGSHAGHWEISDENQPHRAHELSTGRSEPGRISPWCVVRSLQPTSSTGPWPQRPHWRAFGKRLVSSARFCRTSRTLRAAGNSVLAERYCANAPSETCIATARSSKAVAASQPWPSSGQWHTPANFSKRRASPEASAASALAARRLVFASSSDRDTRKGSKHSEQTEWPALQVKTEDLSSKQTMQVKVGVVGGAAGFVTGVGAGGGSLRCRFAAARVVMRAAELEGRALSKIRAPRAHLQRRQCLVVQASPSAPC